MAQEGEEGKPDAGAAKTTKPENTLEHDFNKQMLYVFDEQEIKYRQKLQLYGNMKLIVELYTHNQIPEVVIVTCIDSLLEEIIDQNVEILCQMLPKLTSHVIHKLNQEKL